MATRRKTRHIGSGAQPQASLLLAVLKGTEIAVAKAPAQFKIPVLAGGMVATVFAGLAELARRPPQKPGLQPLPLLRVKEMGWIERSDRPAESPARPFLPLPSSTDGSVKK